MANYCNYKLSRDTEKNPGLPTNVDPNKTIAQYIKVKASVIVYSFRESGFSFCSSHLARL